MKFDFKKYNKICTADFETSTEAWNVERARVWLWDICYGVGQHKQGTSIDTFMETCIKTAWVGAVYGFRNLAYDGTYIISWLLNNGYTPTLCSDKMKPKTFYCVISEMGAHYAYDICTKDNKHIVFTDTLKYVNMSIEKSAEQYKLPIKKGKIDYDKVREVGHIPTQEEIEYITNDTEIDFITIQLNMNEGAIKFTQAGNAKNEFKKLFSKGEWNKLFPQLESNEDKFMRKSYNGGFVYYSDKWVHKTIYGAKSFDINSMYPAQMLHKPMPYGYPVYFSGKYKENSKYPIFIQKLSCAFELKENGIAMISSRRSFINRDNAYVSSSCGQIKELTLSSPDLELFLDNYNIWNVEWQGGYMFRCACGVSITPEQAKTMSVDEVIEQDGVGSYFYDYIKKWRYVKEHAPSGSASRDYAKRMLNALYGGMATNPDKRISVPYLDEEGKVKYNVVKSPQEGKALYLPASIFITAWSRHFLINTIKKNYDRFIYCDTDSLYLVGEDMPKDMAIHKSLFGFFKLEHEISKFRVIGSKRYIYWGREPEGTYDKLHIVCCGADKAIKEQMNFKNFVSGNIFYGKKSVKNVVDGKHIYYTSYKLGKTPS